MSTSGPISGIRVRALRSGVNAVLVLAAASFFCMPPFRDLLPFLAPYHWVPSFPSWAPPVLLLAGVFARLWLQTPSQWLLFLTKLMAALPIILLVSIPCLPEILLDRKWLIATCAFSLLSPVLLSFVSPSSIEMNKRRRLAFVVSCWFCYLVFAIFLFLLLVRANLIPLHASFALLVLFCALSMFLYGRRLGVVPKSLIAVSLLLLAAAVWRQFACDLAMAKAQRGEGDDFHRTGMVTAGPYLQNLQKSGVTVMWETGAPLPGRVVVSRREEALDVSRGLVSGDVRVYESPAKTIHEVVIDSLQENTLYHYRVIFNGVGGEEGSFRTAYEGETPFEFVVYGDSQEVFPWAEYLVRNKHRDVCASIKSFSPEARFMLHVGDMTFLGNEHGRWGREFFGPARELMRDKVLWPVLGNHELNASWYFDFFSVPNKDEHYYHFDFGNSRFIVLAVEGYAVGHEYGPPSRTPMEPGSPQYTWLEKTLEDSQDKTWRFVFFHHPALASGIEGGYTPARSILIPLFERYHVDAVFSGHNHDYEFSVKDGTAYVVTGGGGGPVNPIQPDKRDNPYSRFFSGTWHHCRVHVDGKRIEVKAIDLKGRVFHRFVVDKAGGTNRMLDE